MFFDHHFQNAYVTRNLDSALESLRRQYGLEEFIQFEPDMDMLTPEGPKRSATRVALSWIGNYQVEVIEPVGGELDIYSPYLPGDDGMRFHHVCMRTFDWDGLHAALERQPWPIVFEGHMEGLKFIYVDARAELGHYLEYLWADADNWRMMGGPDPAA